MILGGPAIFLRKIRSFPSSPHEEFGMNESEPLQKVPARKNIRATGGGSDAGHKS
jgi:hypothetical protein